MDNKTDRELLEAAAKAAGYEPIRFEEDPYAATRRAIVRAAAEIGKSL